MKLVLIIAIAMALACFTNASYNPPQFDQDDPQWGDERLGYGSYTIAKKGCFLTATTSMIAAEGIYVNGRLPDPSVMNDWFKDNNGFDNGLLLFRAVERLGFKHEGFLTSRSQTIDAFNEGKRVILNVKHGSHWVLATGYTDGGYNVMDPADVKTVYPYSEVVKSAIYLAPESADLVEAADTQTSTEAYRPPHYSQDDPDWGRERLGFGSYTVAEMGCFLTATTAMIAAEGIHVNGRTPNPSIMNAWFKANSGFKNGLLLFRAVERFGFDHEGMLTRRSDAIDAFNEGKRLILNVKNGRHWVLATDYDDDGYSVMDPADTKTFYRYSEVVKSAIYATPRSN